MYIIIRHENHYQIGTIETTLTTSGMFAIATNQALKADSVKEARTAYYSQGKDHYMKNWPIFVKGPRGGLYSVKQ